MVAGDVGVHVLPEPLDAVLLGTVGRKEVQPDSSLGTFEISLHSQAAVDREVVEDEVDDPCLWMATLEFREQRKEEVGVLPLRRHEDQLAPICGKRSSDVAL